MSSSISIKPPENVYRKPYEFTSAFVFAAASVLLLFAPLPIFSTVPIILILIALMLLRLKQGLRIAKFRKSLKRLPFYALTPDEVPLS
ncbi:MAG: conjugative coupling factor TraD, PFGI-1 class, partial [Neisseriaceae bacterium]|nr:conjugative coupling factor TraD, PFGI-1 class [Neisseriaceae bacterium]